MSRNTLRFIILLAAISIAGIVVIQIYWVRKAFDLRENQFNRDVQSALRAVVDRLAEINHTPSAKPVEQLSTNYFVALINGPVDSSVLGFLISSEFKKRHITADYEYGIYDCENNCMVGGFTSSKSNVKISLEELPSWKNDGYYFGVQFSRIEANLISQMGIWGFSTLVMVIVIFFFVYTLFIILKQKRLSEIQNDFINNMTHEFKTPLSTISISSEVLKNPQIIHDPERLLNYASIIQVESHRLKQQVERVLQMAKLKKSDIGLKIEKLNLHEVINDVIKNATLTVQEKNGQIILELNAQNYWIRADRFHLTNVLFNLLDNAIKYNKKEPMIKISTINSGKQVCIKVHDNGIGIDEQNQKKIFYQFYRVPTGNRHDVKGFGLGLSYVKAIVEAHKGKIFVAGKLESGSTFSIILPIG